MTKLCRGCSTEKSTTEFHRHRRHGDGLTSRCKSCATSATQRWYAGNKKRVLSRLRFSYYGISEQEYQGLLLSQDGVCKICGKEEVATRKGVLLPLSVDHDHVTGKVRGLLCRQCNFALGHFQDDSDALLKASNYLQGVA